MYSEPLAIILGLFFILDIRQQRKSGQDIDRGYYGLAFVWIITGITFLYIDVKQNRML